MAGVPLVPAELGGLVVESVFFGAFLVLFIACIYVLINKQRVTTRTSRHKSSFNRIIPFAAVVMFLTITAHWVLDVLRAFDAFINFADDPGPLAYYAHLSDPKNVAKTGLVIFTYLVGDSIVVYRLYIVWNRNKLVTIIPLCSFLGLLVCGTGITYQFSRGGEATSVFNQENERWISSSFIFTLITNLYSTPMIAYRVWTTNRAARNMGSTNLWPVIQVVVESAAIYTAWTLGTFIAYEAHSNLQFPGLDATVPVLGIVFCLIVVRIALGLTSARPPSLVSSSSHCSSSSVGSGFSAGAGAGKGPLLPLAVKVTRQVVDDGYFAHRI